MSSDDQYDKPDRPVAIVTGGLQGLGLGIAREMQVQGFDIAIVDLPDAPELPEQLKEVKNNEGSCRYYQLDISQLDRHEAVIASILKDFGRLDCLVNNAGIAARPLTDILDLEPGAFDISVDVNLRGTFFLTQKFAKALIESGVPSPDTYRSIIIITSIAAEMVSTERAQYCITKSALSMASKLFAARLGSVGIHVHEIRPGFMKTDMTAKVGNDRIEGLLEDGFVPIPRWGQPEDVGRTVASLASGSMPYMTGQPLWVAGGLNIAPNL